MIRIEKKKARKFYRKLIFKRLDYGHWIKAWKTFIAYLKTWI